MSKFSKSRPWLVVLAASLAAFWLSSASADEDVKKVNCADGEAIQEELDEADVGETIQVSGVCHENIVVRTNGITLVAGPNGASIAGPDATTNTIRIRARRVTVQGFDSISGGRNGIVIQRTGSAIVADNTVESTGRNGVVVTEASYGRLLNNVIQNNSRSGVVVTLSSAADFDGNTVSGNGRDGVVVSSASAATLSGNSITENGTTTPRRNALLVSTARVDFNGPNTISDNSLGNNSRAVLCTLFGAMLARANQTVSGLVIKVSGQCASAAIFPATPL